MTRWYAWFKGGAVEPHFLLILAENIGVAELIANDHASRGKIRFVGLITAPVEGEKN